MRKPQWLMATIGTVMLAAPALAQMPPPPPPHAHRHAHPHGHPPGQGDAMREMHRQRHHPHHPANAGVPAQNRDGAMADEVDARGVHDWLRQARAAIGRGNLGQANEFLERAETRLLSRSTEPSMAGTPAAGPRLSAISGARESLRRRDRQDAMRQINTVLGGG